MDKIPNDLLVDIVRRLDSDDIARCRFASKIFDDAYPQLRSIKHKLKIVKSSRENLFKKIFVNLILNMRVIESVCIGVNDLRDGVLVYVDDFNVVTDEDFIKEWLPNVSETLKSLSLTEVREQPVWRQSNVLQLVSTYYTRMSLTEFENLKHLSVKSFRIGTLLNDLTTTETVEDLTVDAIEYWLGIANETCKLFTLEKLFTVFPKVTSLCIKSFAWRELEYTSVPRYSPQITDGTKGLKTLSAYLNLHYLQGSLSLITRVLDQCPNLLEVSLFIHKDVDSDVLKTFVAKCEAHCPRLNWRRGMWNGGTWLVVQGLVKDTSTYV